LPCKGTVGAGAGARGRGERKVIGAKWPDPDDEAAMRSAAWQQKVSFGHLGEQNPRIPPHFDHVEILGSWREGGREGKNERCTSWFVEHVSLEQDPDGFVRI